MNSRTWFWQPGSLRVRWPAEQRADQPRAVLDASRRSEPDLSLGAAILPRAPLCVKQVPNLDV